MTTLEETLHWITLASSFVASAPKFSFSPQIAAQSTPLPLSQLEPSYLSLGLRDIINGSEFLKISQFASGAPGAGTTMQASPANTGTTSTAQPSTASTSEVAPGLAPNADAKETVHPSLGAHILNSSSSAIATTLQPGLLGMMKGLTAPTNPPGGS